MTTDNQQITTEASAKVAEIQAQIAALTADLTSAQKVAAEEEERILSERRDEVILSLEDWNDLNTDDPESDVWQRITAAGCNGFSVKLVPQGEGQPPVLEKALIPSVQAKKSAPKSGGGSGTRRDLEGEYRAVATPAQLAAFEACKEAHGGDCRGKRWSHMNTVTKGNTEVVLNHD